MTSKSRDRVLCVDDEPSVLEGLRLHLGRRYEVSAAGSGVAGLELIQQLGPFAVVVSDMRMPGMNGAEFLSQVRARAPETTRILLTGATDLEDAVRAINEGQIYRFLTKPCPAPLLGQAVDSGASLFHLIHAEKELLEQTLLGSVRVLNEVLALVQPEAFGRAVRIKQYAVEIAKAAGIDKHWEFETAAILSQLGSVTMGADTLAKARRGQPLTAEESKSLARVPELSIQLLAHIPRLEGVRDILKFMSRPRDPAGTPSPARTSAEMLRIATDCDAFEARGMTPHQAMEAMRAAEKRYDPTLLEIFAKTRVRAGGEDTVLQLSVDTLIVGLLLAEDVYTTAGVLFAARGYTVTEAFVERARNFKAGLASQTIRCLEPAAKAAGGAAGPQARAA